MKIVIGADFVPTKSNYGLFERNDTDALVGEKIQTIIKQADFASFNLEVPLADVATPIRKNGPNLIAPTSTIKGIKEINPYFFTLANNHILDQGEKGLLSTLEVLKSNSISFAGVGKNLADAAKPFILENDGIRVGFYCCVEHEFTVAREERYGANPFNPLESLDHILELKKMCDYVVVLYHGGKEHYRYPSPELRKTCRKIIDKGADLVVCQHSHCIGCEEKWLNGTIVYGQGNFIFDEDDNEFWNTGLLIELIIDKELDVVYHPIVKYRNGVRLAEGADASEILDAFYQRSEAIKQDGYIEKKYNEFTNDFIWNYLYGISGKIPHSIIFRASNRLSKGSLMKWYLSKAFNEKMRLSLLNYIFCETHRELFLSGLLNMQERDLNKAPRK